MVGAIMVLNSNIDIQVAPLADKLSLDRSEHTPTRN
jgi:hypothetical protein